MVERMNFGGGDNPEPGSLKKSRKEVFEEIIEKSRSYDAARREMKEINLSMQREMDSEYLDLIRKLDFSAKPRDAEGINTAILDKMDKDQAKNEAKKGSDKSSKVAKEKKEMSYEDIA